MMQQVQLDPQHFCCTICLDLLKDPVSLACGHNFCSLCIDGNWNHNYRFGITCPLCRHFFFARPVLSRNTMLAEVVESLKMGGGLQAVPPPEPEPLTRAEFLQYACEITLDPNTASQCLRLSKGNRKVTLMYQCQPHPYHPMRFIGSGQVLSREGLAGRCYWEVEWRGHIVNAAVSYLDIDNRAGTFKESGFGFSDNSWSLLCRHNGGYVFRHRGIETKLPLPAGGVTSSRVGVYLDHSAGVLSYYSVSDSMTLIHTVHTTFTQHLYAGFRLAVGGDTADCCDLE